MAHILERGFNCTMVQNHGLCRFLYIITLISSRTQRKIQLNARFQQSALKVKRVNEINLHKPWFCTMVQLKPLSRIRANDVCNYFPPIFLQ